MDVLGKITKLKVASKSEFGTFLKAGREEILLPKSIGRKDYLPGEEIEVFVYRDAEGRLIATDERPKALINECALMKVRQNAGFGSFMDWGISKDLLVPFSEQKVDLEEGRSYIVYVYLDEKTNRLVGSTKLNNFIYNDDIEIQEGEQVELLIADQTDLGYKTIINNKHWGLLYNNEVFKEIKTGDRLKGYIKEIRNDNKIDVSLQKQSYDEINDASQVLVQALGKNKGFLPLHDKSEPGEIYKMVGMSKKTFKKAIGLLYKERRIEMTDNGIRLIKDEEF